jgi:hypothetical protein
MLASHCGDPNSILGNFKWDSWWMNWHDSSFFSKLFSCSLLIIIPPLHHTYLSLSHRMYNSLTKQHIVAPRSIVLSLINILLLIDSTPQRTLKKFCSFLFKLLYWVLQIFRFSQRIWSSANSIVSVLKLILIKMIPCQVHLHFWNIMFIRDTNYETY